MILRIKRSMAPKRTVPENVSGNELREDFNGWHSLQYLHLLQRIPKKCKSCESAAVKPTPATTRDSGFVVADTEEENSFSVST